MSFTWAPDQYARFAGSRLRAAGDLLARIDHPSPRLVHDIGCGRGEMARLMAERWPQATVIGSDLSAEMLEDARAIPSEVLWLEIDIIDWQPEDRFDLLYANAVFHWIPHHEELIPRLVGALDEGGVLAFQMPLSWPEPMNSIARELLGHKPVLGALHAELPSAGWYYDLLAPITASVDIWETTYLHVLTGVDPVLEWAKGAALRPVIGGLDVAERDAFLSEYAARLRAAYPQRGDGTTLLPFPRRFVVARR